VGRLRKWRIGAGEYGHELRFSFKTVHRMCGYALIRTGQKRGRT